MDGNEAAAYVAYAMSDISFIYPISPATSMGEKMDAWAAGGKTNVRGQVRRNSLFAYVQFNDTCILTFFSH